MKKRVLKCGLIILTLILAMLYVKSNVYAEKQTDATSQDMLYVDYDILSRVEGNTLDFSKVLASENEIINMRLGGASVTRDEVELKLNEKTPEELLSIAYQLEEAKEYLEKIGYNENLNLQEILKLIDEQYIKLRTKRTVIQFIGN